MEVKTVSSEPATEADWAAAQPLSDLASDWLTVAQAAACIGFTPQGVYKLIARGEVTAYRFGGVYRLPAASFAAYVAASRVAATPQAVAGVRPVNVGSLDVQAEFSFADDPSIVEGEYTALDVPAAAPLYDEGRDAVATTPLEQF